MPPQLWTLAGITLVAATINGALGYGFSSITVPLALLFLTNRVLNPALVLVEVVLNGWALWVNRAAVPLVQGRVVGRLAGEQLSPVERRQGLRPFPLPLEQLRSVQRQLQIVGHLGLPRRPVAGQLLLPARPVAYHPTAATTQQGDKE